MKNIKEIISTNLNKAVVKNKEYIKSFFTILLILTSWVVALYMCFSIAIDIVYKITGV